MGAFVGSLKNAAFSPNPVELRFAREGTMGVKIYSTADVMERRVSSSASTGDFFLSFLPSLFSSSHARIEG